MNFNQNIYYYPEKHDLVIIKEIDSAGGYEFDTTVVFKDKDNNFYFASDSGCSCPSPFEEFNSVADLTKLTLHEFHALEQEVQRHIKDPKWTYSGLPKIEVDQFLKEVKKIMEGFS
jgi:hypothetical protein